MRAYKVPYQSIDQGLAGIIQLLTALSDPRRTTLREALAPCLVDRISNSITTYQHEPRRRLNAGKPRGGTETKLLAFTKPSRDIDWLLPLLDASGLAPIKFGPSMETMNALSIVRMYVHSVTPSVKITLVGQIDAYCKAWLLPDCTIDPIVQTLVEALAGLWQQNPDRDRRELAIQLEQLPRTSCQFRARCIGRIQAICDDFVHNLLVIL